ncbi:MAG TPA: carbon storage regulator CsrA [Pirellulales bacterium]|jgi:carbon storage regulator CsrA|nr:carbon storage regulator CsrA [Pirellulales bacterium]
MLVLTRKTQEQIQIGNNIKITILRVKGQSVQIGIEAPREVRVLRAELQTDVVEDANPTAEQLEHQPIRAGVMRNPPAFERRETFGPLTSPVPTSSRNLSGYVRQRRASAVDCVLS